MTDDIDAIDVNALPEDPGPDLLPVPGPQASEELRELAYSPQDLFQAVTARWNEANPLNFRELYEGLQTKAEGAAVTEAADLATHEPPSLPDAQEPDISPVAAPAIRETPTAAQDVSFLPLPTNEPADVPAARLDAPQARESAFGPAVQTLPEQETPDVGTPEARASAGDEEGSRRADLSGFEALAGVGGDSEGGDGNRELIAELRDLKDEVRKLREQMQRGEGQDSKSDTPGPQPGGGFVPAGPPKTGGSAAPRSASGAYPRMRDQAGPSVWQRVVEGFRGR